jgi:hypothetical protein
VVAAVKRIADDYLEALRAAGLADENTRRVVIDLQCGHVPIVHIEKIGDERLLSVVQALGGVQIARVEAPEPPAYVYDILHAWATGNQLDFGQHEVPAEVRARIEYVLGRQGADGG